MTPDQIAAEIAEKAVPSMTPEEIAELRDRLSEGVICTGETETDDGVTELYDVDDATDAMADAACAIDQLLADRAALLAKCERYRDALEAIEDHTETDMDTGETGLSEAAQIARTALTEAP